VRYPAARLPASGVVPLALHYGCPNSSKAGLSPDGSNVQVFDEMLRKSTEYSVRAIIPIQQFIHCFLFRPTLYNYSVYSRHEACSIRAMLAVNQDRLGSSRYDCQETQYVLLLWVAGVRSDAIVVDAREGKSARR